MAQVAPGARKLTDKLFLIGLKPAPALIISRWRFSLGASRAQNKKTQKLTKKDYNLFFYKERGFMTIENIHAILRATRSGSNVYACMPDHDLPIAEIFKSDKSKAERIVECWNAFHGVENPMEEIAALRKEREIRIVIELQWDKLLKSMDVIANKTHPDSTVGGLQCLARSAITKSMEV